MGYGDKLWQLQYNYLHREEKGRNKQEKKEEKRKKKTTLQ